MIKGVDSGVKGVGSRSFRHRAVEPSSGSNVIPRRARPGLAGLRPFTPTPPQQVRMFTEERPQQYKDHNCNPTPCTLPPTPSLSKILSLPPSNTLSSTPSFSNTLSLPLSNTLPRPLFNTLFHSLTLFLVHPPSFRCGCLQRSDRSSTRTTTATTRPSARSSSPATTHGYPTPPCPTLPYPTPPHRGTYSWFRVQGSGIRVWGRVGKGRGG